jgi:hypothetical protein
MCPGSYIIIWMQRFIATAGASFRGKSPCNLTTTTAPSPSESTNPRTTAKWSSSTPSFPNSSTKSMRKRTDRLLSSSTISSRAVHFPARPTSVWSITSNNSKNRSLNSYDDHIWQFKSFKKYQRIITDFSSFRNCSGDSLRILWSLCLRRR